jgi:hypothetical protein
MRPSATPAVPAATATKIAGSIVAVLVALLSHTARADTHCYGFRNDSTEVVALSFSFHPSTGNVITGAAIDPGKTYPFDGRPWCWNLPEGTTATVTLTGPAVPRWKGTLVLGNGSGTAPSGTYVMGAASANAPAAGAAGAPATATAAATAAAATAAPAAPATATGAAAAVAPGAATAKSTACLANPYPNNEAYCLTALETGIQLGCGVGHTGISGTIVVNHLTVKCNNGRSLKLTCGTTTGGRQKCNLNDHAICTDDSVRSAADFCGH